MNQNPIEKYAQRNDGGLSKIRFARRSILIPLGHVLPTVKIHAPSFKIFNQFPSSSISINLAFQLSDKTLKSS